MRMMTAAKALGTDATSRSVTDTGRRHAAKCVLPAAYEASDQTATGVNRRESSTRARLPETGDGELKYR